MIEFRLIIILNAEHKISLSVKILQDYLNLNFIECIMFVNLIFINLIYYYRVFI